MKNVNMFCALNEWEKSESEFGVNILEWNSEPTAFCGLQVARHEHYNQEVYCPRQQTVCPSIGNHHISPPSISLILRLPSISSQ